MSTDPTRSNDGERFTAPAADRPPTDEESAAAERAAADVDLDRVSAEYEEMAERGANVRGEGEIEPG
ncbi:MAG: hypothetical protein AB7L17_05620 [Ilumatobacteraceae bacterium]|jgi:hypothetical protein